MREEEPTFDKAAPSVKSIKKEEDTPLQELREKLDFLKL